jgi:hypothetical protein
MSPPDPRIGAVPTSPACHLSGPADTAARTVVALQRRADAAAARIHVPRSRASVDKLPLGVRMERRSWVIMGNRLLGSRSERRAAAFSVTHLCLSTTVSHTRVCVHALDARPQCWPSPLELAAGVANMAEENRSDVGQHLFASTDQRLDAERSLTGHGYDTWCSDLGGRYSVLMVDHPDLHLDRVNILICKACRTMPGPRLGESSDTRSCDVGLARSELAALPRGPMTAPVRQFRHRRFLNDSCPCSGSVPSRGTDPAVQHGRPTQTFEGAAALPDALSTKRALAQLGATRWAVSILCSQGADHIRTAAAFASEAVAARAASLAPAPPRLHPRFKAQEPPRNRCGSGLTLKMVFVASANRSRNSSALHSIRRLPTRLRLWRPSRGPASGASRDYEPAHHASSRLPLSGQRPTSPPDAAPLGRLCRSRRGWCDLGDPWHARLEPVGVWVEASNQEI